VTRKFRIRKGAVTCHHGDTYEVRAVIRGVVHCVRREGGKGKGRLFEVDADQYLHDMYGHVQPGVAK
jgi:hypothetical protein